MSSPSVSRWPVLLQADVRNEDRDDEGALGEAGAERLFALARDAYLDACRTVEASDLRLRGMSVRRNPAPIGDTVTVSAGVVEILPDAFTLSVRIRATGDAVVADVTATFATADPIPASMRDEFIALAHNARHFH